MKFTHRLPVNPDGVSPLTRTEVWHGLLRRVYRPALFFTTFEHGRIKTLASGDIERTLDLGGVVIEDRISLVPMCDVHFCARVRGQEGLYRFSMSIEGQGADMAVQFSYDIPVNRPSDPDQGLVDPYAYLRKAYIQCDRDTLALMRPG
jgi:hypothetical protein